MDVLVEDVWPLILEHLFAPSKTRLQVSALKVARVSHDWERRVLAHVHASFVALRKHIKKVDEEVRMRYAGRMFDLQTHMADYCRGLGLDPWRLLCAVEPAWKDPMIPPDVMRTYRLLAEMDGEDFFSPIIRPWNVISILKQRAVRYEFIVGPWSFGGEWTPYILALFLGCDGGLDAFQSTADLAADHFNHWWGDRGFMFFSHVGNYYGTTGDSVLLGLIRDCRSTLFPNTVFSEELFKPWSVFPSIHHYARANSVSLPSDIPCEVPAPSVDLDLVFPGWETFSPVQASGLYHTLFTKFAPSYPQFWTPEIRKKIVALMRKGSVSFAGQ
jgi:hypothetical protein